MKRFLVIVSMSFIGIVSLLAQVPQRLTYQALIRNTAGNVVSNQDLDVKVSIIHGSIDGDVVYSETHSTSTTANGVVTLEIGGGKTSDDFSTIDWSNGPFFVHSSAELDGKTISVASQLLSVPYALYARKSFLAQKVDEDFLEAFVDARAQSLLVDRDVKWDERFSALDQSLGSGVDDRIQAALAEADSLWESRLSSSESGVEALVQASMVERDSICQGKFDALESSMESGVSARIQNAMTELDSVWLDRLASLESSTESGVSARIQNALSKADSVWQERFASYEASMESGVSARIQNALAELDSIWRDKFAALEATMKNAIDSVGNRLADSRDTVHETPDTVKHSVAKHGVLPGVFGGYRFSQGVLQYHAGKKVWRFADSQFEILGTSYKDYENSFRVDWVDQFEFATSGYYGSYPHYPTRLDDDYFYPYSYEYDWGYNNAISNGGNTEGVWHIFHEPDWWGILCFRENAENLYSKAEVDGMRGFVLLPDDWSTPSDLTFTPRASFGVNVYNRKQWDKMEALGAVFFPQGRYWGYGQGFSACVNFSEFRADMISDLEELAYTSPQSLLPVRLIISDEDAKRLLDDASIVDEIVPDDKDFVNVDSLIAEAKKDVYPEKDADTTNVDMKAGVIPHKYSVSDSTQVYFSQGNLLYNWNSKEWRFSDDQINIVDTRENPEWSYTFTYASSGYYFKDNENPYYENSFVNGNQDISGSKYDWGVNNPISNGGNVANLWRVLTSDEWRYVLNRKSGDNPLAAPVIVGDNTIGCILLPDDWSPSDIQLSNLYDYFGENELTLEQWKDMESKGAVFLNCEGNDADYSPIYDMGGTAPRQLGGYWSSSGAENGRAWTASFYYYPFTDLNNWRMENSYFVMFGAEDINVKSTYSVRLVRDVK